MLSPVLLPFCCCLPGTVTSGFLADDVKSSTRAIVRPLGVLARRLTPHETSYLKWAWRLFLHSVSLLLPHSGFTFWTWDFKPLTGVLEPTGMHAFRPAQTVPGEQLADDGAVWSQGFDGEHHAGAGRGGPAGLPEGAGIARGCFRFVFDFKRIYVVYNKIHM